MFSPLIDELIRSLRILPGVGPKTAQRMALYLLERNPSGASKLAQNIQAAVEQVKHCGQCRTLTEQDECNICRNHRRDASQICVVESPADVFAIEASNVFSGKYFVLHGQLSPIDGIGPGELGLERLFQRFNEDISELILATSTTMEGEATAHYIADKAKECGLKVTRIAHGVPMGGELEYIDGGTLAHALSSRREF